MLREIETWLDTKELDESPSPLSRGFRYSPQALRTAGYLIAKRSENPFTVYNANISFYLAFIGAIGQEEHNHFFNDIRGNIQLEFNSLFPLVSPTDGAIRNIMSPNIEAVAEEVKKIRSEISDVVVVLNHGKWNTYPHLGYMAMYLGVMEKLAKLGHPEEKVVFVVSNDTNKDIELSGGAPFLNTFWRMSANSYLPYDIICSSGDFDSLEMASNYWVNKYRSLKPDYVVVNPDDKLAPTQLKNIRQVGGIKALKLKTIGISDRDVSGRKIIKGFHTSGLTNVFDVDFITYISLRNWISEQLNRGTFDRSVNWKNFLAKKTGEVQS